MFSNINCDVRTSRRIVTVKGDNLFQFVGGKNIKVCYFQKPNDLYQLAHILFKNNFSFLLIFGFFCFTSETYHLSFRSNY